MASAEQELYQALKSDTAVFAEVGDRIYPDFAEDDEVTLPLITFSRTGTTHEGGFQRSILTVTFDVFCLAATREEALSLAVKVRAAARAACFYTTNIASDFDPEGKFEVQAIQLVYNEVN